MEGYSETNNLLFPRTATGTGLNPFLSGFFLGASLFEFPCKIKYNDFNKKFVLAVCSPIYKNQKQPPEVFSKKSCS